MEPACIKSKLERATASLTPEDRAVVPMIPPAPRYKDDINNIQGDVYPTFPKKYEGFSFFTIKDVDAFRRCLDTFKVTSSADTIEILKEIQRTRCKNIKYQTKERADIANQFNIAFSWIGCSLLGVPVEDLKDETFQSGPMRLSALTDLGDQGLETDPDTLAWDPLWMDSKTPIHGVIVSASQDEEKYSAALDYISKTFGDSIEVNFTLKGRVREDKLKGHEFFGFLDGISQPCLNGLVEPHAGQLTCEPGVIIHGLAGDPLMKGDFRRPSWAKCGTIMAFRKLQQHVLEFQEFCKKNAIYKPGDTDQVAADRCGARMFGRWPSGAPLDIPECTDYDKPKIGKDVEQNNAFDYTEDTGEPNYKRCPITSHVRKVAPRRESTDKIHDDTHLIMRGSIPYGEEIDESESIGHEKDRGLLFASYQSDLNAGFTFLQKIWSNNVKFPPNIRPATGLQPIIDPGYDPIIGARAGIVRIREAKGTDPDNLYKPLLMTEDFITARGGEYFWVPPLAAIRQIAGNQNFVDTYTQGSNQ